MKQPFIVIIDYDVGNVFSVLKALETLGYTNIKISRSISDISSANALILPGVGAFEECINNLHRYNLHSILNDAVLIKKKPILGICVGMQLMADYSEENGKFQGLGWISGKVTKLKLPPHIAIPHVGWNDLAINRESPLFKKHGKAPHFYFDHSYQFLCDKRFVIASCNYTIEVTAAINHHNIFGVQFHPEKSQISGLKLFRSFFDSIELC